MIDFYTWTTPNGRKVSIFLEETGLPYRTIPIDLEKGEQTSPAFTAVSPNQKIPAIVDHDLAGGPVAIFESGAILIHLAEKSGQFLPTDPRARAIVMQWLMYQMSHVGPILGQVNHFVNQAPEQIPYAINRFLGESLRILGVLNGALANRTYLGDDYSIADMATYPWVHAAWEAFAKLLPNEVAKLPDLQRWIEGLGARPGVQRGMAVPQVG
jgi:GSH-dependent disulfide-bond oxidoreductase